MEAKTNKEAETKGGDASASIGQLLSSDRKML